MLGVGACFVGLVGLLGPVDRPRVAFRAGAPRLMAAASEPALAPSVLLTLTGARRAMAAAEAESAANGWRVTIV